MDKTKKVVEKIGELLKLLNDEFVSIAYDEEEEEVMVEFSYKTYHINVACDSDKAIVYDVITKMVYK